MTFENTSEEQVKDENLDDNADKQISDDASLEDVIGTAFDESSGEVSDTQTQTKEQEEDDSLKAPEHWAKEDAELFNGQPKEVKEYLLNRDKAMTAAHTKRSQEIKPFTDVAQKWSPYLGQISQQTGQQVTFDVAADKLMEADYILRTSDPATKYAYIHKIAQDYGIDLKAKAPEPNPVYNELQNMRNMLQQTQMNFQSQQANAATAQVEAFKTEVDDKGQLLRPYFDEVEGIMATMAQAEIASGKQPDLAQIYDAAVWSNPQTREKVLAQQSNAANGHERADRNRIDKARKAGGSVTGAGTAGKKDMPSNLNDLLEEIVPQNW